MNYRIDAKNKKLGRVASEIATILQGKKTVYYNPRLSGSDQVMVENVKDMAFSGNKLEKKKIYRHTGYMGHLKFKILKESFAKNPSLILRQAVARMLPKNFLRDKRMLRLIIK